MPNATYKYSSLRRWRADQSIHNWEPQELHLRKNIDEFKYIFYGYASCNVLRLWYRDSDSADTDFHIPTSPGQAVIPCRRHRFKRSNVHNVHSLYIYQIHWAFWAREFILWPFSIYHIFTIKIEWSSPDCKYLHNCNFLRVKIRINW